MGTLWKSLQVSYYATEPALITSTMAIVFPGKGFWGRIRWKTEDGKKTKVDWLVKGKERRQERGRSKEEREGDSPYKSLGVPFVLYNY